MVNSGSINGRPVHANNELLTKWLKEDLNWDGMIVTDWADINNLYTREYVAHDKKRLSKWLSMPESICQWSHTTSISALCLKNS